MSKLSGLQEDSVPPEEMLSSQDASYEPENLFLLRERRRIKVFLDSVESVRFIPLASSVLRPAIARRKKFLDLEGRLSGIVGDQFLGELTG